MWKDAAGPTGRTEHPFFAATEAWSVNQSDFFPKTGKRVESVLFSGLLRNDVWHDPAGATEESRISEGQTNRPSAFGKRCP